MKYIDLSHTITNNFPVYPGDDEVQLNSTKVYHKDGYSNSNLEISMHVGTHIDGPMHLTDRNKLISEYPLTQFIGNGYLINASNEKIISMKDEYLNISKGDIVLIYTGFDKVFGTKAYFEAHPVISNELTNFLINKKVKMIGIDFPSPDYDPFPIHKELLNEDILIIENLINLDQLINTKFEVIALPLKINADSSIARVIARVDS